MYIWKRKDLCLSDQANPLRGDKSGTVRPIDQLATRQSPRTQTRKQT